MSLIIFYLLINCVLYRKAAAMPQMVVNTASDCSISVDVAGDTIHTIYYELHGIDVSKLKPKDVVSITVNPKAKLDDLGSGSSSRWKRKNKRIHGVTEVLSSNKGAFTYTSGNEGETLELCIRSKIISRTNPLRIGVRVIDGHDKEYYRKEATAKKLSDVEMNLIRTLDDIKAMVKKSDFARGVENSFHERSMSVYKAAMWWPLIQTLIVLVTGVTTIMHIVSFLNKRVMF